MPWKQHAADLPILPLVAGIIPRAKGKLLEMTPNRWMDQLVGAVASALLIALLGWLMGIPKIQAVQELLVIRLIKVEQEEIAERENAMKNREESIARDHALMLRMQSMEAQHQQIIGHIQNHHDVSMAKTAPKR